MAFDYTTYIAHIRALLADTGSTVFTDTDIQTHITINSVTVYRAPLVAVNYRLFKTAVPYWLDDGSLNDVTIYEGTQHDADVVTPTTGNTYKGVFTFDSDQGELYIAGTAFNLHQVVANLMLSYLANYKHDYDFSASGSYSLTSRRDTYQMLYRKYAYDAAYWQLNDSYMQADNWPYNIGVFGYQRGGY
jgi:hypothetical protein